MLQEKYHSYPLPKKELPKLLVWLIVPLIEKSMTRKMISRCMGHKWNANNQKSISKLEVKYTSIKKSIEEMFQQMIEQGQI